MKIEGLTAIVTGGASGLGKAAAQCLAAQKCNVIVADLNQKDGEAFAQELQTEYKVKAFFCKVDVGDENSIKELINFAVTKLQNIHIVLNSAGILSAVPIVSSKGVASSEEFTKVFKINVLGTFNVSKYAAQQMIKQQTLNEFNERGVIINVSSVAGIEGQRGQTIYSATKGAIIGMTLPMARDLGRHGIRVVTIAPGIFQTPMGKNITPKYLKTLTDQTAINRLGQPKEFGDAIVGLATNSYVTGSIFRLDGGIRLSHL